ncbi:MAG: 2Fe-2S iron-sulfur cluster-binding protein [Rhizobiaceae bacterium]|jgi:predicted molibdopterin-dependent oxidoreductase YjgC
MSRQTFLWRGSPIPLREGESVAAALAEAGIVSFGRDGSGRELRYFCGIGACQSCLVKVEGRLVEACLTPAMPGLDVGAMED